MPRPKQTEIPMEGPGVTKPQYKELDKLGDAFIDVDDQIEELKTELSGIEQRLILKMREYNLGKYRFGDYEITLKEGAIHAKVKEVKVKDGKARSKIDRL